MAADEHDVDPGRVRSVAFRIGRANGMVIPPGALGQIRRRTVESLRHAPDTPYSPRELDAWLFANQFADDVIVPDTFLAIADHEIIGFGRIDVTRALVVELYVSPESAGNGAGRALMQAMHDAARRAGCTRLHLKASLHAVTFYERIGYTALLELEELDAHGHSLRFAWMEMYLIDPDAGTGPVTRGEQAPC